MLNNCTAEQLQQELDKRKRQKDEAERPKQLEDVDLTQLRESCQYQIDHLATHGYTAKDADHYIYEAAMIAIFGKGVFQWINKKMR